MKKIKIFAIALMMIFALTIIPFAIGELEDQEFIIGVGDQAPTTDVILATDINSALEDQQGVVALFSELETISLDNKITLLIYNNEAIIVIGESSPVSQVQFAIQIQDLLNELGITNEMIINNQITVSNFEDLFETQNFNINCEGYGLCDAFADGQIDNLDANWILSYVVGEVNVCAMDEQGYESNLEYCDIDGDGTITAYDASLILQYVEENTPTPECTSEGEITNPSLGPNYYVPCCSGLELFYLGSRRIVNGVEEIAVGAPSVCYNPNNGEPECDEEETDEEGFYYPNGELLLLRNCNTPQAANQMNATTNNQITTITSVQQTTPQNVIANNKYADICKEYGWSWFEDSYKCVGMTPDFCEKYKGKFDSSSSSCNNEEDEVCTTDAIPTCYFSKPNLEETKIANQEKTKITTKSSISKNVDKEIKLLQSVDGIKLRFLQLEKAIIKAAEGQKIVIEKIEEKNTQDLSYSNLMDINMKLSSLVNEIKLVDLNDEETAKGAYLSIKETAKEVISLFKEEAHKYLNDGEINELKNRVQIVDSTAVQEVDKKVETARIKYNSDKINNVLTSLNIKNEALVKAVEDGVSNYGEIRSVVAKQINDLSTKEKKNIVMTMNEAKAKSSVQIRSIQVEAEKVAERAKEELKLKLSNSNDSAKQELKIKAWAQGGRV